MYCPEHTSSYYPSKIPSSYPSAKPFQNSITTTPLRHTQPTTHRNLSPSLLPIAPPLLHITNGPYQATSVATRVTLYSSSRLDTTYRASTGCSSASSRAQGLRRDSNPPNSHSLSLIFHCIQYLSLV